MGTAIGYTIPAPSLGLDLVSPIDQTDPNYALDLSNIVSAGFSSFLRNGYTLNVQIGSAAILALQGLNNPDGTNSIIAHTSLGLYRIVAGVATNIGGASNVPFNSDTFGGLAYFVNGTDGAQQVGTTGSSIALAFTGPTLTNLITVSSYKSRQYFGEKNSFIIWYPVSAGIVTGALTSFDFKYAFKDGGFLVAYGSYTNNESNVSEDLFYLISSEGEVVLYSGDSPSDTAWILASKYKIGRPVGFKCTVRVGNDTWVITNQGIVSLATLFSQDPLAALRGVGLKINPYITQQALAFPFSSGWSGTFWAQGRRVYITVPTSATTSKTLVYHIDGGWSFYSLGADSQGLIIRTAGNKLYYGGVAGSVWNAETGQSDGGSAITFAGTLAYNFFGSRGQFKAFKDIRPLMRTTRAINLALGLNTNFQQNSTLATLATSTSSYTPWGSPWGSPWSTGISYIYDRHTINGQGHSAALQFKGSLLNAPLEFYGFEIGFEPGSRV